MRTFTMLLVALLILSSVGSAAQTAGTPQLAKIRAQVQKRGTGEKSKVSVTLENGTIVKGYISKIDDSYFGVNGDKAGQATTIAYTDVRKVQGPGLSTGAKIGIGVLAGLAVAAAVVAVLVHKAVH